MDLATHKLTNAQAKEALRAIEAHCRSISKMRAQDDKYERSVFYHSLSDEKKGEFQLAENIVWLIVGASHD